MRERTGEERRAEAGALATRMVLVRRERVEAMHPTEVLFLLHRLSTHVPLEDLTAEDVDGADPLELVSDWIEYRWQRQQEGMSELAKGMRDTLWHHYGACLDGTRTLVLNHAALFSFYLATIEGVEEEQTTLKAAIEELVACDILRPSPPYHGYVVCPRIECMLARTSR